MFHCKRMKCETLSVVEVSTPPMLALNVFSAQTGISPITLWRMRKKGWLRTMNISGRQYLSSEAIAEFKDRAARGEFAKQHKVPAK